MTEPVDRVVTANGVRLHYVEWGAPDRPAMLLLHGGSAHARWWDFCIAPLLDRYRVLSLDLRGHGDSEWSATADYDLETHVDDVLAVIDALALRDFVLVGHSFGGMVALATAARPEAQLAALVLIDTRAQVGERAARFMEALRKMAHPVFQSADDAVRRFRLLPVATGASPEVLAHVARHAIRERDDGTWTLKFDRRAIANTRPCDLTPALAAVRCPLLVVRAAESELMSREVLEEMCAAVPGAQGVEIAASHHHIMLDQPLALAAALNRFLGA